MAQKKFIVGGLIVLVVAVVAWWMLSSGPLGQPAGARDAENAVKEFGEKLQSIPIGAESDTLAERLQAQYGELVDPALLEQWSGEPLEILGRPTDSLWVDRIEVESTKEEEPGQYRVTGTLIGVAPDSENRETAGTRMISVLVENKNESWIIIDITLGSDYE